MLPQTVVLPEITPRRPLLRLCLHLLLLPLALPALVAAQGGVWQPQGPAPAIFGQVEHVGTDNQVDGAIHAVAAHPTNPAFLYVGAVNGGIWKTSNATASTPTWTHQSDGQVSLSISVLEFDPTDAAHETLVAGTGRYSSFGTGGSRVGLLRTTNGGASWTPMDGGGLLLGKNISGVAPRGSTIVVAVNTADSFSYSNIGIFRSINGGSSFTQVSDGNGSATGLPGGVTYDLARDPGNNARLFTSVTSAPGAGGTNGIYRSDDTGATWSKKSNSAIDSLLVDPVSNVEISVGTSNNVYVAIVRSGRLAGVFRSGDSGNTWTAMDLPTTIEDGFAIGIHPGGQGGTNLSVVADPSNANVVYIGGDRQPYLGELSGAPLFFPNSIGAANYSGRLFRGDASLSPGQQWVPLTHVGTASNSSPHADSRDMAVDAQGNLIETDDGGVYKRTSPANSSGDWFSLIGNLQVTEYHSTAYDANAKIVIGGAQDTGTTQHVASGSPTFLSVSTADGGDTAVDDHSTPGLSTRYSSFQYLGSFRRRSYNAANALQTQIGPALTVLSGGASPSFQFYTPIAVNEIEGNRLIIGASNSIYESLDQGNTITEIGPGRRINAFAGTPILYGVPGNPNLLYAAAGSTLLRRTAAPPAALTVVTSPSASTIQDLAIDPDNPSTLFSADSAALFLSIDSGASWSNITGNLATFSPGRLRTLAFVPALDDALVVGADRGVFVAFSSTGFSTWSRLGSALPNAPVFELDYDPTDDILVAGLLGRGAWSLQPALTRPGLIFADDFESGNTSAWSTAGP